MRFQTLSKFLLISLLTWIALPVLAAPAEKTGFVDVQKILETPQGREIGSKLEKISADARMVAEKDQRAFEEKRANLDKQSMTLSKQQLDEKMKALEAEYASLQQKFQGMERNLAQQKSQLSEDFYQKIRSAVETVAQKNDITMVVDKKALLWSESFHDLTDKVITEMR